MQKQFGKAYIHSQSLDHYKPVDKQIPYLIEMELKGSELLEIRYEQLWSESPLPLENSENAFRVIAGVLSQ